MDNQELRQALNKVEITGVVKEHKLSTGKTNDGKKYVNGALVVKAGEFTEVTVKVFVSEKNSNGKVKKAYENLKKILDGECKTMAEVPEEEAVKVRLWGNDGFTPQFKEEMYKPESAPEVITRVGVDLGFGNVTIDNNIKPEDYKATFDVEVFVESVIEELNRDDEETGRVIVKGWCPVYGGSVIPLEIIAGVVNDDEGEYDFAEDIRDSVDPDTTINLWGDIDYRVIIEKTTKGGGLGRAKTEEKRTYVHDLIAVGADFVEGDDEYDIDAIKKARNVREEKKQEVENKEDNTGESKKRSRRSAARTNRVKSNKSKTTKKPSTAFVDVDDDDLPF